MVTCPCDNLWHMYPSKYSGLDKANSICRMQFQVQIIEIWLTNLYNSCRWSNAIDKVIIGSAYGLAPNKWHGISWSLMAEFTYVSITVTS